MILAALALAATETPEQRLERIYRAVLEANRPECNHACRRPVLEPTSRGGFARGFRVSLDPDYMLKRSDPEYAFVMCHEFAHVLFDHERPTHSRIDREGLRLCLNAGFDRDSMVMFLDSVR